MTDKNICPKCQKPKDNSVSGTVTQFIERCLCDVLDMDQATTIIICSSCGKRIANHIGSLTQWVFGQGQCECLRPAPVAKPVDSFVQPKFSGFVKDSDEEELKLEQESFPVDRYMPLTELGKGANGKVYLCKDRLLKKKVAVKTLLDLTQEQLISFQDEAKATAKLNHPNIVRVLDFGVTDSSTPYMVMDYIPGISLERYLDERQLLDEDLAISTFSKLANALEYAHKNKVYHRDIKPSNIILYETDDGIDVRLIDFGIAKVKEATGSVTTYQNKTIAGTPLYMSPDPIRGASYDLQSEVYALGCVMFESLAGQPPFIGETALDILSQHVNSPVPQLGDYREDLSSRVEGIVANCLAKEKSQRFASMQELKNALELTTDKTATTVDKNVSHNTGINNWLIIGPSLILVGVGFIWMISFIINGLINPKEVYTPKPMKLIAASSSPLSTPDSLKITKSGQTGFLTLQGSLMGGSAERFKKLKYKDKLNRLSLSVSDLTADTLIPFLQSPIETILFSECNLDKNSFKHLGKMKKLHTLALKGSALDEGCLSELRKSKSLRVLRIWNSPVTDYMANELTEIHSIQSIHILTAARIPNNFVSKLSRLPKLEDLRITRTPVTEKNFSDLRKLKHLNQLHITVLPGDYSKVLRKLRLRILRILDNSKVTNKDLLALAPIKTLEVLEIKNCTKITTTFSSEFRKLNSKCKLELNLNFKDLVIKENYKFIIGE